MENAIVAANLETIPGTEQGSHYFVLAKANGLVLAVRPIIFIMKTTGIFHLGVRLRAVLENMDGDLNTASTVFNFPEGFYVKGAHASMVAGMPVAEHPFSPNELNLTIKEHGLVSKFAEEILGRLTEAGITPIVSQDILVEILNLTYDTELAEKLKKPIEYKAVFGLQ